MIYNDVRRHGSRPRSRFPLLRSAGPAAIGDVGNLRNGSLLPVALSEDGFQDGPAPVAHPVAAGREIGRASFEGDSSA